MTAKRNDSVVPCVLSPEPFPYGGQIGAGPLSPDSLLGGEVHQDIRVHLQTVFNSGGGGIGLQSRFDVVKHNPGFLLTHS